MHPLSKLMSLDLSGNLIGYKGDNGTVALGEALPFLPELTHLDLGCNYIGRWGDEGTVSLGKGLSTLRQLAYLSFGGEESIFNGNKSGNAIGAKGINGTIALGEALQNLSSLTYLDLSNNNIGMTGEEGLTALGAGLRGTPNLQTFLFIPQETGLTPAALIPINQGLQYTKAEPLPFVLLTEEEVQNYVATLPQDTTTIDLSGHLSSPSADLLQTLFERINLGRLNIMELKLQNIGLDAYDSTSTQRLGELLPLLPNLTLLDMSYNYIGGTDGKGTMALGKGLQWLSSLTSLNLSRNFIFHGQGIYLRL